LRRRRKKGDLKELLKSRGQTRFLCWPGKGTTVKRGETSKKNNSHEERGRTQQLGHKLSADKVVHHSLKEGPTQERKSRAEERKKIWGQAQRSRGEVPILMALPLKIKEKKKTPKRPSGLGMPGDRK